MLRTAKKFVLSAAMALALAMGLGAQPADAAMIGKQQEIELGREVGAKYEAQYGVSQDWELQERINTIGQKLAAVSGRTDIEYSFKVLNSDQINAFACPGGFIYVYKGLIDYMPTDAELAGVLGHEVGHVAKKHIVHAYEKAVWTNLALIAVTRGQGAGLTSIVSSLLQKGYSRTDERGADKEGVRNSIEAGYNPYAMLVTVYKLDDLSKQGGGGSNGLFNDHPEPEERIKRVTKQLQEYDIHPDVNVIDDDNASVQEGDWTFNITQSIGNTKAKYRAYMLAGALWQVRRQGTINPNYFVVYDNGSYADIYYDEIQVLRLYPQDAGSWGSAGAYASACCDMLKSWSYIANANDAAPKTDKKKKKK